MSRTRLAELKWIALSAIAGAIFGIALSAISSCISAAVPVSFPDGVPTVEVQ